MTGRVQAESINPCPIPDGAAHIWGYFLQLNRERSQGMNGSQPLTSSNILAWMALEGVQLEHWELTGIRALDRAAMESYTGDS